MEKVRCADEAAVAPLETNGCVARFATPAKNSKHVETDLC